MVIDGLSVLELNDRYSDNLIKAEKLFRNGEAIKTTYFLGLCEKYGVKLPARTKRWAQKNMSGISQSSYMYVGSYASTVIMRYARELAEKLRSDRYD